MYVFSSTQNDSKPQLRHLGPLAGMISAAGMFATEKPTGPNVGRAGQLHV